MKFTSEDLMKAMGLSVGDKIKWNEKTYTIFQLCKSYFLDANEKHWISVIQLIGEDYEILPRPKRVGNLNCDDFECCDCPLNYICCLKDWSFATNNNLFNILEKFNCDDQEIYNLLKARLDKEVLDNDK